jgi:hypothetical protein
MKILGNFYNGEKITVEGKILKSFSVLLQVGSSIKLISNEDEAAEAVRNILGSSTAEPDRKRAKKSSPQQQQHSHHQLPQQQQQQLAAHLSGQAETMDPLQKCAEEILAGVKRPTAVEGSVVHFLLPDKQSG